MDIKDTINNQHHFSNSDMEYMLKNLLDVCYKFNQCPCYLIRLNKIIKEKKDHRLLKNQFHFFSLLELLHRSRGSTFVSDA
jgi:hypothetical protein